VLRLDKTNGEKYVAQAEILLLIGLGVADIEANEV
jgi:hypothetical protein